MQLDELIKILEECPPDKRVKKGIGNPHSWRGVYSELAFEIVEDTTFGEMLDAAKSAVGKTFGGWKGGVYAMNSDVEVHIEPEEGIWTDGGAIWALLIDLMLEAE